MSESPLCNNNKGVRRFVPDKFIFEVLDKLFAVGIWGFGVWFSDFALGMSLGDE